MRRKILKCPRDVMHVQCVRSRYCIDNLFIIYIHLKRKSICKCNYAATFDVTCLVFRDSGADSENVNAAFCIRWPENMQFIERIIDRYMINFIIVSYTCISVSKYDT